MREDVNNLSTTGATAVAALTALLLVVASAQPPVNDPRCAGYDCSAVFIDSAVTDFALDASECDSLTCSDRCLSGPAWEPLLLELGCGNAERSNTLWFALGDWLSTQFPDQIFKILATEVLGYKVRSEHPNQLQQP